MMRKRERNAKNLKCFTEVLIQTFYVAHFQTRLNWLGPLLFCTYELLNADSLNRSLDTRAISPEFQFWSKDWFDGLIKEKSSYFLSFLFKFKNIFIGFKSHLLNKFTFVARTQCTVLNGVMLLKQEPTQCDQYFFGYMGHVRLILSVNCL